MEPNRTVFLTLALLGAVMLYLRYRTQAGQTVAVDAIEEIVVSARRIGAAVGDALLPRGIRNNNPGNIEFIENPKNAWRGQIGTDGRFGVYDTAANGVRAIGKELLLDATRGIKTVRGLISNWAPSNENDTQAYAAAVARALGVGTTQAIDVRQRLPELVAAIIQHENGAQPYSERDLNRWVYLA